MNLLVDLSVATGLALIFLLMTWLYGRVLSGGRPLNAFKKRVLGRVAHLCVFCKGGDREDRGNTVFSGHMHRNLVKQMYEAIHGYRRSGRSNTTRHASLPPTFAKNAKVGHPPAVVPFCTANPEVCVIGIGIGAEILQIYLAERLGNKIGNAIATEGRRELECEQRYEDDLDRCRKNHIANCYAEAAERYAACLAGRQLPPFHY